MKQQWYFDPNPHGDISDPDPSNFAGEDEGSRLLVRETLQNIIDAKNQNSRDSNKPAIVRFRLREFVAKDFAELLELKTLDEHFNMAFKEEELKKRHEDEKTIPSSSTYTYALQIEDYNTIGLDGPSSEYSSDPEGSFLALCGARGANHKKNSLSGGTYGVGKNVLWRSSFFRTVFFYSRLEAPYSDKKSSEEERVRFYGKTSLTRHDLETDSGKEIYLGPGFFGRKSEGENVVKPFINDQAEQFAEQLGMIKGREEDNAYGTTILIPWLEEDISSNVNVVTEATAERFLSDLYLQVAKWYWPALSNNQLQVEFFLEEEEREEFKLNGDSVNNIPWLVPFLDAYLNSMDKENQIQIPVKIPSGKPNTANNEFPEYDKDEKDAVALLGLAKYENSSSFPELEKSIAEWGLIENVKLENSVAHIRGQGMVIFYEKRSGSDVDEKYAGVLLAGLYENSDPHDSDPGQQRMEYLLSRTEPPAHDKWMVRGSAKITGWKRAGEVPAKIRREVKNQVNTFSKGQQSYDAKKAAPSLSKLLTFSSGKQKVSYRDVEISLTTNERKIDEKTGEEFLIFEGSFVIPSKDEVNSHNCAKFFVVCSPSADSVTKIRSHSKEEALKLDISMDVKSSDGKAIQCEESGSEVIVDISDERTKYNFLGQCGPISPSIADDFRYLIRGRAQYGERDS